MKRMVLSISSMFFFAFLLTACGFGSQNPKQIISDELGIDVSSGKELSSFENHSGFHGDGTTYISLRFLDHQALKQIEESAQWKKFPLDRTARVLVYGISDVTGSIGPFLNDDNGNPLVPEISNGYYLLIDRHTVKEMDMLKRSSINLTLGLYDTDTDTLYYCKLDT